MKNNTTFYFGQVFYLGHVFLVHQKNNLKNSLLQYYFLKKDIN